MNIRHGLKWFVLGAICGVALLPSPADAAEKKIIMRYSHSSSAMVKEPHHAAALDFKNFVEKATNGKVEVQIYPGSQLGGEERSFQDIQQGVIQIASLAVNNVTVFSPSMGVFDLPYMFTNYDDCYKLIDQNWKEINKRMIDESGNMAVGWLVQGFRVLSNSKHPIRTLGDLKGLKIRVPNNPIMIATFRAWGGEPAPMAWDETFNALQQKVVDGQENPYPVFASNKFEEVQKYITEIHYKMWIGPIVVNAAWLKRQPADVQKAILEGGRIATENNRKMIAEMEAELVTAIKASGVEIVSKPDDEAVWQEKAMSVWPQFYDKIGDISLLDTMMKTLGRSRPQ
ncbi:TRAP transporter substrate-binding protein [uncultured Bilophila sp.]|uniref:TRAP transporter substrate-binding protein n=1 Tax=uncultured Bilophila sp. TaxID=529385 RepID=UPI0026DAD31B|nr:TRAP transporter substrate-binding protein [uncultured Bilophila sp.]